MKFLLSNGKQLRKQVLDFPFASEFTSSKLLVCACDDEQIVAACGIRGLLNTLVLYVKESHRNRGVGKEILSETIQAAKTRGQGFVTLSVSSDNAVALSLYKRMGFIEVLYLEKSRQILMMLLLTYIGKLAYEAFSAIRFFLPNSLLFYVHAWLYKKTI